MRRPPRALPILLAALTLLAACSDASQQDLPPIDASDAGDVSNDVADAAAPACADADSDGVCDEREAELGTDPAVEDTDGDGYWDGWEDTAGTDPLDLDDHPDHVLPEGRSYALEVTEFVEPASLKGLVGGRLSEAPPVLLFVDGLTDGAADAPVALAGGIGELVSIGADETPKTADDTYAMAYYSISQVDGRYIIELDGQSQARELLATADTVQIDLSGFSTATRGVRLRVDEVEVTGTFDASLTLLSDVRLTGKVSDQGLDELLEATQDILPLTKEQALALLDPDGDGVIPVELGLDGREAIVDGFTEPADDVRSASREPGTCCPEDLAVGDPIYDHLTWADQGIQDDEWELWQLALAELTADPDVALIATAYVDATTGERLYEIHHGGAMPAGHITFRRVAGTDGAEEAFEIVDQSGDDPFERVDPTAIGTYEALLAAGVNPAGTEYLDKYDPDDQRVVFVPADEMHYGFAYERITQIFDDPRTGDVVVLPASWAMGGFGTHGHLNNLQSRSPLIIGGPGVRRAADGATDEESVVAMANGQDALVREDVARAVDIAPTIAAALGVAPTTGVGPDGRLRDDVLLGWQDGRVLREIFTPDALAKIDAGEPVAERAIIIINDGLTSAEILHQTLADDSAGFAVDQYRRLMASGTSYRYGSITNYPSNTYPSHNTIGSGAWSGHHGIVDNGFWARELGADEEPIQDIFETEYLLGSAHAGLPVETLHEAVLRTWPGELTASINDPSSRGAPLATLERRYPSGFSQPDAQNVITIGGTDYQLPEVDVSDYGGVLDNASAQTFAALYLDEAQPLPKYAIVNFGSTDTAGHAHGPHGDHERHVVIARVNQRLELLFATLEEAGILDSTLVVLTSDHGMELMDRSRTGSEVDRLQADDSPVRVRMVKQFLYFKTLGAEVVDAALSAGATGPVTLRVFDADTRWAEQTRPVEAVAVSVVDGGTAQPVETAADGTATVSVAVDADATEILVELTHEDWTTERLRVPVD